jgi:1,4-dihydroxy-2-naphthoate octaprenyltransferase
MSKTHSNLGVWWVAVRPFAYSASVIPVVLGAVLAWHNGHPFLWGRFALTLAGMLCFHTAANLLNDCFDYRRGLDVQVNPGSGAVVRGLLTSGQVKRAAWLCLGLGSLIGLTLVWLAGWMVLWLGLAGMVLVLGYTRSGLCFKYVGLGDAAIFTAFGLLPVLGTYWVQAEAFAWQPVLWAIPLVAYTIGILHANNWRDIESDAAKDCRTPAVRLGYRASRAYYRLLVLGPFALVIAYIIGKRFIALPIDAPLSALAVLLALPMALKLAMPDWRKLPEAFAVLDARNAQLQMVFGTLLILAFIADALL